MLFSRLLTAVDGRFVSLTFLNMGYDIFSSRCRISCEANMFQFESTLRVTERDEKRNRFRSMEPRLIFAFMEVISFVITASSCSMVCCVRTFVYGLTARTIWCVAKLTKFVSEKCYFVERFVADGHD